MKKISILFLIFVFFIFGQDRVIVVVGNKPIFESEVIYRSKKDKIDFSLALQKLIEEKLLLYQAEKNKIEVSKEEIKEEIDMIKKSFPSLNEFYDYLKQSQIKIEQIEQEIENNLKIKKLIKNEILSKIEISPFEIANEIKKIEQEYNEYEFFFKWFDSEKESEKFVEKFNLDSLKEMEFAKLKSSEIIDEIIKEISELEKGKLTSPIKIGEKWIVIYLNDKRKLNPNKIESYRQAKDRIFKIKYSNLYKEFIEKLKRQIPIKFL
ncbi:MAG: SurA N-terminal domain-containing protein [Candidatus Omnitrophica bacterium]|nr:SurA N-terminal domain-containing protein [Candidatus Omnitrophota bacterium]